MKTIEFLKTVYTRVNNKFPEIEKIEYFFHAYSYTHFVKVFPQKVYDSSKFKCFESDIYDEWHELQIRSSDFEDDFGIISEGSLIKNGKVELIYQAPKYSFNIEFEKDLLEDPKSPLTFNDFYSFDSIEGGDTYSDAPYKLAA